MGRDAKELRARADIARSDQRVQETLASDCRGAFCEDHAQRAAFHAHDAGQLDALADAAEGRR